MKPRFTNLILSRYWFNKLNYIYKEQVNKNEYKYHNG